jgi:hypothetical protein
MTEMTEMTEMAEMAEMAERNNEKELGLLGTRETAALCGYTAPHVANLVRQGLLKPLVRLSCGYIFDRREVERFLEERKLKKA